MARTRRRQRPSPPGPHTPGWESYVCIRWILSWLACDASQAYVIRRLRPNRHRYQIADPAVQRRHWRPRSRSNLTRWFSALRGNWPCDADEIRVLLPHAVHNMGLVIRRVGRRGDRYHSTFFNSDAGTYDVGRLVDALRVSFPGPVDVHERHWQTENWNNFCLVWALWFLCTFQRRWREPALAPGETTSGFILRFLQRIVGECRANLAEWAAPRGRGVRSMLRHFRRMTIDDWRQGIAILWVRHPNGFPSDLIDKPDK